LGWVRERWLERFGHRIDEADAADAAEERIS
jgi:hypothetical protein